MSQPQFSVSQSENGQTFITVFANGKLFPGVDDTHPNFAAIKGAAAASVAGIPVDADQIADLFDVATAVARRFERLSERVTVENGVIMFDGDPAQNGLSTQILRFMNEGEDFEPLVNFLEKIGTNPNEHSVNQAWDWLNNHDFSIFPDGDVLAYKGVYSDGNGGLRSGSRGHAFRNGEEVVNDYVTNAVGDVIEMPRSEVMHDPAAACHAGLHVGTYRYATGYARGAMLKVKINPRDIVSVPTDARGEKIRVCRYTVLETIDAPVTTAIDFTGFLQQDDDSSALSDRPFEKGDKVFSADEGYGVVKHVYDDLSLTIAYENGEETPYNDTADARSEGVEHVIPGLRTDTPLAVGDDVEDFEGDESTITAIYGTQVTTESDEFGTLHYDIVELTRI